jgi:hypothetical protein
VAWADAGDVAVRPLDRVIVAIDGAERHGHVFVIPELLVRLPHVTGKLMGVESRPDHGPESSAPPGSEMPPLGSKVSTGTLSGTVIQIDPVEHTVTVAAHDGEQIKLAASVISPRLGRD